MQTSRTPKLATQFRGLNAVSAIAEFAPQQTATATTDKAPVEQTGKKRNKRPTRK